MMKDHEFVSWMADRMVHVYGESPNVDFVHRARAIAENIARYDLSADACESLRARLAKYEDAEGRPVAAAPEQAKDALEWIDDFIARCNGDDRGACESVNVIRNYLAMRSSVDKEDLRDLLEALVFADVRRVKHSGVWHEELHQRAIDMLARLNSSPVSADLTASECACGDQYPANSYGAGFMAANNGVCENCDAANSVSAGGVDERAAFEGRFSKVYDLDFDEETEEYKDPGDQALWYGWQARAALSAPSHGEQVRKGWRLVPFEPNEAIRDAINLLCDDHSAFEDSDAFWSYLLAATPSAGSQEQE